MTLISHRNPDPCLLKQTWESAKVTVNTSRNKAFNRRSQDEETPISCKVLHEETPVEVVDVPLLDNDTKQYQARSEKNREKPTAPKGPALKKQNRRGTLRDDMQEYLR